MIKSEVFLQEPNHRYFNQAGREFLSVSRVISYFKEEFQSDMLSYMVAKKRACASNPSATNDDIQIEKKAVLAEWALKNKIACDKGTEIHDAIETWLKTTFIVPKFQKLIDSLSKELSDHPWKQSEIVLHFDKAGIAGTTDYLGYRTKSKTSVIDIVDWKSNKIERRSKYGKYLKGPLAHLEDCNYNTYSLQLSLYAFMIELQFGRQVGNLSIVEIVDSEDGIIKIWPAPYMKQEVRNMLIYAEKNQIISFDVISSR